MTQFCVLILPHHCKNMKHAHHLFMARVYWCRAIWDRGGRVIDCLQPAPCLRGGSDFNELIKIIIITIINVIIGGVSRPSEWNTGQGYPCVTLAMFHEIRRLSDINGSLIFLSQSSNQCSDLSYNSVLFRKLP